MSIHEYGATHATLPSCFTSRKRSSVRLGIGKLPVLGFLLRAVVSRKLGRNYCLKDIESIMAKIDSMRGKVSIERVEKGVKKLPALGYFCLERSLFHFWVWTLIHSSA